MKGGGRETYTDQRKKVTCYWGRREANNTRMQGENNIYVQDKGAKGGRKDTS